MAVVPGSSRAVPKLWGRSAAYFVLKELARRYCQSTWPGRCRPYPPCTSWLACPAVGGLPWDLTVGPDPSESCTGAIYFSISRVEPRLCLFQLRKQRDSKVVFFLFILSFTHYPFLLKTFHFWCFFFPTWQHFLGKLAVLFPQQGSRGRNTEYQRCGSELFCKIRIWLLN